MAGIMFGNLSTIEILDKINIELTKDEINKLESMRFENADGIPEGKWHCFEKPFNLVCGDEETANIVAGIFMPHADNIKIQMQISYK